MPVADKNNKKYLNKTINPNFIIGHLWCKNDCDGNKRVNFPTKLKN